MKVFNNNLVTFFTSPVRLGIVLILPFIFVMLFLSDGNGSIDRTVSVFDHDNTKLTKGLIEEIDKSCVLVECEEDKAVDALINAKIDYAITIPKGYTEKLLSGDEVYIEERYFINEEKLYPLMQNINTYINNAVNINEISEDNEDLYKNLGEVKDYSITYEQRFLNSYSTEDTAGALGFMMQFIMYSGIMVAAFLLRDKESNVTIRMLVSPISLTRYMMEHFISYVAIEVVICFSLTTVLNWVFGYYFAEHFLLITTIMVLFAISVVALSVLIVSICKKSITSYWVLLVLTTPMVMLGGCYFDIESMPTVVQNAANFIPTKWAMEVVRDILINNNTERVLVTVIALFAFALVYLSISRIGLKSLLEEK